MDFARYLPLSRRGEEDESRVSSDRRREVADVAREALRLLRALPDGARDERARRFFADAGLTRGEDVPHEGADDFDTVVAGIETGPRRSVAQLAQSVRATLVLADEVGTRAAISPMTLGAVALHVSARAPFDRRAVIRGHTVVATDADWRIGRGPHLRAPAEQIVRFLLGLSDRPPQP